MKERYQNPTCGDTLRLRLFTYNENAFTDVYSIEKVEIYFADLTEKTEDNPEGLRLVQVIDSSDVQREDTGKYYIDVTVDSPSYTIGNYYDVWTIKFQNSEECSSQAVKQPFQIYPSLWFTTPVPLVLDYNVVFRPNRFIKGTKKYLIAQVNPNVTKGSNIESYYTNLISSGEIRISIAQICGECIPKEQDLRLIVDRELITNREGCYAYYYIDTTEMDCGIYDVWFEITVGESVHITEKNQIQVTEI